MANEDSVEVSEQNIPKKETRESCLKHVKEVGLKAENAENGVLEFQKFLGSALEDESTVFEAFNVVQEFLPRKEGWELLKPFLSSLEPTTPCLCSVCLQLSLDNENFQVEKFLSTPWLNDDEPIADRLLQRLHGHAFPTIGDSRFANAFLKAWEMAEYPSNSQLLRIHEVTTFHSFNEEKFVEAVGEFNSPSPTLRCAALLVFTALKIYPQTLSFLWELETLPEKFHWVAHFYLWDKPGKTQIFHAMNFLLNGDVFSPINSLGRPINPEDYFHKNGLAYMPQIALALGIQLGKLPSRKLQPELDKMQTFVKALELKWETLRNLVPERRLFSKMKHWYFFSVYRTFQNLLEANQNITNDCIITYLHILSSIQFAQAESNIQTSVLERLSKIINAKFPDSISNFLQQTTESSSDLTFQIILVHNRQYYRELFLLQFLPSVLRSLMGSNRLLYVLLTRHFVSSDDGKQFYLLLLKTPESQEFALQCLPQCITCLLTNYPENLEEEDFIKSLMDIASLLDDQWKVYIIQRVVQDIPRYGIESIAKDPKLAAPHRALVLLFDKLPLEYISTSFHLFENYFESLATKERDLIFAFYLKILLAEQLNIHTKDALFQRFLTSKRDKAKL